VTPSHGTAMAPTEVQPLTDHVFLKQTLTRLYAITDISIIGFSEIKRTE
jgi:hypothetical protein